ncbi:hypothetical protein O0L34_g18530 [Tuta absoluta]|nr:hypothetical protein O0L34_g18530 [Tuta absoluta]
MSNIYIQEPPALGKVLLKTSAGEIDIELWTKEAPKACRNFIQLCMEGYYNGTIFHRVVPGFIVQGGDPNGDGTGGESIYGETFKDEFHSRLRFNRRGLVAMANAGKDDNGSQFFFTLGATPELQNKHTIFGKVTGETIYNMLKLSEGLIGPDDRPEHPHRIKSTAVLINPFEDIVPRVREVPEEDVVPKKKKKEVKAVKNFGLLSFGEEAEEEEGEAQEYKGKPKSTHDLLDDPQLSKKTAAELEEEQSQTAEPSTAELQKKKAETESAINSIRDKLSKRDRSAERDRYSSEEEEGRKSDSEGEYYIGKERDIARRKERDRIRNEIKQLKKEMKDDKTKQEKEVEKNLTGEEREKKLEEDNEMYKQYVDEQEKYKKIKEKIPKKGAARESFTLQLLAKFKDKLHAIKEKSQATPQEGTSEEKDKEAVADDDDVNNDDWLGHTLKFEDKGAVLAKDASTKGDDWFDIYDPRNPINKRKREMAENNKGNKKK